MAPIELTPQGVPIYYRPFGSGMFIVVEAKPGSSGKPPGGNTFNSDPADPSVRPDLQLEANRDLGNGSAAICDMGPAGSMPIGGVPGINPPSFDLGSQTVADALNDFGCRFDLHTTFPCTLNDRDNPQLVASDTTVQLCTTSVVGHEVELPTGDTLFTVQWRDNGGNISLPRQIIIRVP